MLPWRRPFDAPDVAAELPGIRKLLLAGQYREGVNKAFEALTAAGLAVNTKAHPTLPAFTLKIDIAEAPAASAYLPPAASETAPLRAPCPAQHGDWIRRTFVPRPPTGAGPESRAPAGTPAMPPPPP